MEKTNVKMGQDQLKQTRIVQNKEIIYLVFIPPLEGETWTVPVLSPDKGGGLRVGLLTSPCKNPYCDRNVK